MNSDERKLCGVCGSFNLIEGHTHPAMNFTPVDRTMMMGYQTRQFLCTDCGAVTRYVDPLDLKREQKLREDVS